MRVRIEEIEPDWTAQTGYVYDIPNDVILRGIDGMPFVLNRDSMNRKLVLLTRAPEHEPADGVDADDPSALLDIHMEPNDAGADTVRDYLKAQLARLWSDGDSFSGKRPFGESGWESHVYVAFARAGLIHAEWDPEEPDSWPDEMDDEAGEALIHRAIGAL